MVSKQNEKTYTTISPFDMTEDILNGMKKKDLINYAKDVLSYEVPYSFRIRKIRDSIRDRIRTEVVAKQNLLSIEDMEKAMQDQQSPPVKKFKIPSKARKLLVKYNGISSHLNHRPPAQVVRLDFYRGKWVDLYIALWGKVKDRANDLFPIYSEHYITKAGKPESDWMAKWEFVGAKVKTYNRESDVYVESVKVLLELEGTEVVNEIRKWHQSGEPPFGRNFYEAVSFIHQYELEHKQRKLILDYIVEHIKVNTHRRSEVIEPVSGG